MRLYNLATIYFIDSENVGSSWTDLLGEIGSRFLVFYTSHSPRMAYAQINSLMNATNNIKFLECHEGNNGLDFQLVTYLGYELRTDNTNEMVIVSNDSGFDAVVHFWQERNMKVRRVLCSNASNSKKLESGETVSNNDMLSTEISSMISSIDRRELYTIINCIGADDPSHIHLALIHFYGNKKGEHIYKCLKKEKFAAPPTQWREKTRMEKLIELIIKYVNTSKILIPDSLQDFIVKNVVSDKKTMSDRLNILYGESGQQLNKMFKPFYATLAKIKK